MRRLELEPGLTLYENPMAGASGAYFLPALSGDGTPEFPEVRLDAYAPGRVELSYLGHTPGWVVLPMRWYPGWHAKVDGQDATVERFLDLVPAIAVNGPAQIEFRYAPRAYYRAAWLSASAWLALLVFVFVARRRQGRDSGPP
jgi:hypothetical protein